VLIILSSTLLQVGVFSEFSGAEFDNFVTLAEKLRSDYTFSHTKDAKFLPHGGSSVDVPFVRLFKPFDELFSDSQVYMLACCLTIAVQMMAFLGG
jgi:hypothetical protein